MQKTTELPSSTTTPIDFETYANWTDKLVRYPEFSMYPYLALAEEAGEVLGAWAKYERGDYDVIELNRRLKKEVGDVLFMVARILRDRGWTANEIIQLNVDKLEKRVAENKIKGDGDDR